MSVSKEFDEGFKAGFLACKKLTNEGISEIKTQTGHQPSPYEEWVFVDRRASDVKADCLEVVEKLTHQME